MKNCSGSALFVFQPAALILGCLIPLFALITIGFTCALLRLLIRKLVAHPSTNILLLNASISGILASADMIYTTRLYAMAWITGDACYVAISKQDCAAEMARLIIFLSIFNLSLIFVGVERALVGTLTYMRTARGKEGRAILQRVLATGNRTTTTTTTTTVPNDFFPDFLPNNTTATVRAAKWWWPKGTTCASISFTGSIWFLSILLTGLRFLRSSAAVDDDDDDDDEERMDFCTGQKQELTSTHFVSIVLNLASLGVYAFASWISRRQLKHFANSQTHFTLSERSELRYNLHVTEMIGPVILYACICITLNAARHLIYDVHDSLDSATAHIINLYIFLLVNYGPILVFAAYSYRSFRMLQIHGPSLVISLPTNPDHQLKQVIGNANNDRSNHHRPRHNKIGGQAPKQNVAWSNNNNDNMASCSSTKPSSAPTTTNITRKPGIARSLGSIQLHTTTNLMMGTASTKVRPAAAGGSKTTSNNSNDKKKRIGGADEGDLHFNALSMMWGKGGDNNDNNCD